MRRMLTSGAVVLTLLAASWWPARAVACVRAEALDAAVTDTERERLVRLDEACRDGLALLRAGRPGEAYGLLRRAAAIEPLLDRSLALPLAESMVGAGAPVEATLMAWERLREPASLVASRRFELVERLPQGRAAALLAEDPRRAAADLLRARAARDSALTGAERRARAPEAGRIGVLLPLSGRLAPIGRRMLDGIRLGLDADTTLVLRDSGAGAMQVATLMAELAASGVTAVIGPVDRAAAGVAADAARTLELPLLRLSVSDSAQAGGDWVLRAFLSRRSQGDALVAHAMRSGWKRLAIVHTDSAWGVAASDAFAAAVGAGGGRLVHRISYPAGTTNLTKVAREIAAKPFEAVFVVDSLANAGLVLRFLAREDIWTRSEQRQQQGSEVRFVQILGPAEWHASAVPGEGARYLRGAIVAVEWPGATDSRVRAFADRARTALGAAPTVFEAVGFDVIRAVQAVRSANRLAVAEGLRNDEGFGGVLGRVRFGSDGEPRREVRLFRITQEGFEGLRAR